MAAGAGVGTAPAHETVCGHRRCAGGRDHNVRFNTGETTRAARSIYHQRVRRHSGLAVNSLAGTSRRGAPMPAPDHQATPIIEGGAPVDVVVREGVYGEKVVAVEPGGAEFIPLGDRHGRPLQLFWTWTSPNLEFATVFVGVLGVAAFGLSFWQAALAIILGTGVS